MIENLVLVKTGDLHKDKTFVYAYKMFTEKLIDCNVFVTMETT
jgi:hypothetical protein